MGTLEGRKLASRVTAEEPFAVEQAVLDPLWQPHDLTLVACFSLPTVSLVPSSLSVLPTSLSFKVLRRCFASTGQR